MRKIIGQALEVQGLSDFLSNQKNTEKTTCPQAEANRFSAYPLHCVEAQI